MHRQEFERIGKRLLTEGLVAGNFGNMSVRADDGFYITRTGSYLDDPGELVLVPQEGTAPSQASNEYRVHREVYRITRHKAIVHAHPPHAVACSLLFDEIVPQDSEGEMLCPLIPIVQGRPGSEELAVNVAEALRLSHLAIARGHGTFAGGKTLDQAYLLTSLAEHSCKILGIVAQYQ
jgi:L-fuculose-phosphate aldolase